MLTQTWKTSERKYRVREERDFSIPTSDGIKLNSYLYRPDADGKFPVILGVCAYSLDDQVAPVMPVGAGGIRGHMEAGDPEFLCHARLCACDSQCARHRQVRRLL